MPEYRHDRIPYIYGRDVLPLRRQPRRYANVFQERLFARENELRARINELDGELVALSDERRQLLDGLGSLHEQLRPRWGNSHDGDDDGDNDGDERPRDTRSDVLDSLPDR